MSSKLPWGLRSLLSRLGDPRQELMTLAKLGINTELRGKLITADGVVMYDRMLGRKMVTNAGVQFIANAFLNTVEAEIMNYHDSGTGVTAAAVTDTALQTATGIARSSGTQTSPSNGVYRTVAVITYNAPFAITEHGLFSATSSGTLMDRTVFPALNVASGDSIQFTFSLTFNAGG